MQCEDCIFSSKRRSSQLSSSLDGASRAADDAIVSTFSDFVSPELVYSPDCWTCRHIRSCIPPLLPHQDPINVLYFAPFGIRVFLKRNESEKIEISSGQRPWLAADDSVRTCNQFVFSAGLHVTAPLCDSDDWTLSEFGSLLKGRYNLEFSHHSRSKPIDFAVLVTPMGAFDRVHNDKDWPYHDKHSLDTRSSPGGAVEMVLRMKKYFDACVSEGVGIISVVSNRVDRFPSYFIPRFQRVAIHPFDARQWRGIQCRCEGVVYGCNDSQRHVGPRKVDRSDDYESYFRSEWSRSRVRSIPHDIITVFSKETCELLLREIGDCVGDPEAIDERRQFTSELLRSSEHWIRVTIKILQVSVRVCRYLIVSNDELTQ